MGALATTAAPARRAVVDAQALAASEPFLADLLADLEPVAVPAHAGRPRILPSVCLWAGVLVCLLRGATTQTAVWRLLTRTGLWHYPRFPLSDQAIYRRLAQETHVPTGQPTPLERLFQQVCGVLHVWLTPLADTRLAPFATQVYAVDETTLDRVARWLPALRGTTATDAARFPGKLTALFDLRRQLWQHVAHVPDVHQNEKADLGRVLAWLERGCLLVMDLGYFSFAWFDQLTDAGVWWVSRLRQQTSYERVHAFYDRDGVLDALIWLGRYRADRSQHLVRLVQFTVGPVTYRYLTNQTDPVVFPLREIARVYQRRWDIELAFKLVKQHLQLHVLWSSKERVLLAQVWGVLLISQVLQALRLRIAHDAGVDPFEVSLALLVAYVPQYLAESTDPVAAFVQDGRRLGFLRPSSRTQNRAPYIPATALAPPPPNLPRSRPPRYAHRKAGPRPRATVQTHD